MDTMEQLIFASTGLSLSRYADSEDTATALARDHDDETDETQRLVDWVWN